MGRYTTRAIVTGPDLHISTDRYELLRFHFHLSMKVKNSVLRIYLTFKFIFRGQLSLICEIRMEQIMQTKVKMGAKAKGFAEFQPTRRPRTPKDGVLVHDSGGEKNGLWRPLSSRNAWIHVHRRSLEAMA